MHTNMPLGVIKHTLENMLENTYRDKGNDMAGQCQNFCQIFFRCNAQYTAYPYTPSLPLEYVLENLLENNSQFTC